MWQELEGNTLRYYLIALLVIILDQITKWIVATKMDIGESIQIIERVFYLTSHRNRGAAFGILQGQMWLFYIITVVVIIGIVYYMKKEAKNSVATGISLGLILGGAIGNFIDRVFRGEVVDFIDTYIFGYDFAIFNVADAALCIGVGLLFLKMISDEWRHKKERR